MGLGEEFFTSTQLVCGLQSHLRHPQEQLHMGKATRFTSGILDVKNYG